MRMDRQLDTLRIHLTSALLAVWCFLAAKISLPAESASESPACGSASNLNPAGSSEALY